MADIHIVQEFNLTPEQAQAAAQQVAGKLGKQYDMECIWAGSVLNFERSGVSGSLTLTEKQALMQIKLGFMFSTFSSQIESKIAYDMKKVFNPQPAA